MPEKQHKKTRSKSKIKWVNELLYDNNGFIANSSICILMCINEILFGLFVFTAQQKEVLRPSNHGRGGIECWSCEAKLFISPIAVFVGGKSNRRLTTTQIQNISSTYF